MGDEGTVVSDDFGMKIYHFGEMDFGGPIYDLTVLETGEIFLISRRGGVKQVVRCNARGEYMEDVPLIGMPPEFAAFTPEGIFSHDKLLYIADKQSLKIVLCEPSGLVVKTLDLESMLDLSAGKKEKIFMEGFGGDSRGNILFTLPWTSLAYILRPDESFEAFGENENGLRRFESLGQIGADADNFIYVSDPARHKILVFSPELSFITEFGSRGFGINYSVGQIQVTRDDQGCIYISHSLERTISVFKTSPDNGRAGDKNPTGWRIPVM